MRPEDGRSSPPSAYSRELLPLPDGPVIAAASPFAIENVTSVSTSSDPRGVEYDLQTRSTTKVEPAAFMVTPWPPAVGRERAHRPRRGVRRSGQPCSVGG